MTATVAIEAPGLLSPAEDLTAAFWKLKAKRVRVSPSHTTRASSIGEACERKLFYSRTAGEMATPHKPDLQAIFDLGKELEGFVLRELEAMGVEVVQRERDYHDRALELTAHSDARIRMPGWPTTITAEVKGLNPYTAESIETIEDLRDSRQGWVRKYYDQLQAYLYFDGGERGVFVLLNKVTGQIRFIDCPRDQARIDELLAKAARIRDAVRADQAPERHETDDCLRCPFLALCMPGRRNEGAVVFFDQAEAIALVERRLELADAKKEFDAVDRQLKALLPEAEEVAVGDFMVRGKWTERAGYTVQPTRYITRTYVRIGGK